MVFNYHKILKKLEAVSSRGECLKRKVGCLIVADENVLIEAFNGMPEESGLSCVRGDCPRCKSEVSFPHGVGYDLCFCLHAEEKAIALAAKRGISLNGAVMYTSYQPCIMCMKMIAQSGIIGVRFIEVWHLPDASWGVAGLKDTYETLANSLTLGVKQVDMPEIQ